MKYSELKGSLVRLEQKPQHLCRKWKLMATFGTDPETGKRITRTKKFEGDHKQAQSALEEFLAPFKHENNEVAFPPTAMPVPATVKYQRVSENASTSNDVDDE